MTIHYQTTRGSAPAQRADKIEQSIERMVEELNAAFRTGGLWRVTARVKERYSAKPWEVVLCDPTGGSFVVLLPDPTRPEIIGTRITIKNDCAFATTIGIQPVSGTIDGQSAAGLSVARGSVTYSAISGEWKAVG